MASAKRAAEKAVLAAALEYAEAYEAYSQAFDKNRDGDGYNDKCERVVPLHTDTAAALKISHEKENALKQAISVLHAAVATEPKLLSRRERRARASRSSCGCMDGDCDTCFPKAVSP